MNRKLLFVYNAETGFFNKLTDFAHKIVSPSTYACSLCALTYGNITMLQEWAEYLKSLPVEVEFSYKNECGFPVSAAYPLVALQSGDNRMKVVIDAQELNQLKSLKQLKTRLDEVLQQSMGLIAG